MIHTPWPSRRRSPTHQGVGWGIIGASQVAATAFLPTLRRLQYPSPTTATTRLSSTVLGIYSSDEARGQRFAATHAIPHAYLNLVDLLEQPDIQCVYIANHPRHHAQTALAALAAGKHVLVEPPLALDVEEAQRVAHTALGRGRILAVNYVRRADPAIRALRELLADQAIGDILCVRAVNATLLPPTRQTWRLRTPGGGVLLDRTHHAVDLVRHLLRDEVSAVYCAAAPHLLGSAVPEDVQTQLSLRRHGILAHLHDSYYLPHVPGSLEIYGTRGVLVAQHCWEDGAPSTLQLIQHGHAKTVPVTGESPYAVALQAFHAAVGGREAALASGADGVHSLQVVQAALESLLSGRRVALAAQRAADRSVL